MSQTLHLIVNGVPQEVAVDADATLLTVLRDTLGLAGSKIGCGEGQCGVCTIVVADQAVRACNTPAAAVDGQPIVTIEGLAQHDRLHPLQQAFLDMGAFQCGYCTPGMIMNGVALLRQNPEPTVDEIKAFMQGNLCRCGAYRRIIAAIQQAAAELRMRTGGGSV